MQLWFVQDWMDENPHLARASAGYKQSKLIEMKDVTHEL
jgi:hypothetical protein